MAARKVKVVFISSNDSILKPGPPSPLKIDSSTTLANWKTWEYAFRNHARAINLYQKSPEEQISTFRSLIGPDAMDMYNNFNTEDTTDLESIIKKFGDHFKTLEIDVEEVLVFKEEEEEEEEEVDQLACKHCGYRGATIHAVHGHILKEHTEKRYVCVDCNRRFVHISALKAHVVVHLPDSQKHLVCKECNKRFACVPAWKAHVASHLRKKKTKGKPEKFTCEICYKDFSQKCNLQTHMRRHTGEKPYICHLCDFKSACQGGLSAHLATLHSDEKPYKCNVCDYRSKLKGCLTQHLLTHTNELPHSCNVCGKRFRQSSHAKRHMMTHTGEKPYACKVCGHRWTTNGNLRAHMKIHLREAGEPSQPRQRKKKTAAIPKPQTFDNFSDHSSDDSGDSIIEFLGVSGYKRL